MTHNWLKVTLKYTPKWKVESFSLNDKEGRDQPISILKLSVLNNPTHHICIQKSREENL